MGHENLTVHMENRRLLVTINRPQVLNALSGRTLAELGQKRSRRGW